MLPEYIPMHVAESILFAGKAVRVLRNPSPAIRFQDAPSHQQMSRGSQRAQGYSGQISSSKDSSIGDELLPQSDANKIEYMLQDLKVITCYRIIITYFLRVVQKFLFSICNTPS